MKKISILINADDRLGHISPEIYGHFSEHLGRCIYNGISIIRRSFKSIEVIATIDYT